MKTQALVPARLEFFPHLTNSPLLILPALALAGGMITGARAEELTLASAPPVVIRTVPAAGATDIDPSLTELQVTFNKDMQDRSWSWSTWGQENFPETTGSPRYLEDHRTCVLPVKLGPGKFYATWLNSHKFTNFKDASGNSAVPYLLTFQTAGAPKGGGGGGSAGVAPAAAASTAAAQVLPGGPLDEDQLVILKWTETSFRSFFDSRTFDGWSEKERTELETRLIDTLKGPQNREYLPGDQLARSAAVKNRGSAAAGHCHGSRRERLPRPLDGRPRPRPDRR